MDNYMARVIDAKYIKDYTLEIVFSNGEKKVVDFRKYIYGEVFEPLKDIKYFKKFFVDGWTVSWPNGADVAPDTLYID